MTPPSSASLRKPQSATAKAKVTERLSPLGFYGSTRVQLPLFALVAVGTVLIGIIPFPSDARREILVGGALFFLLVSAAFLVPWERLPDVLWVTIPVGYIAVIAIIRDAQGASGSSLVFVYILPIVWVSLYGQPCWCPCS
jgi:hypothetical protein